MAHGGVGAVPVRVRPDPPGDPRRRGHRSQSSNVTGAGSACSRRVFRRDRSDGERGLRAREARPRGRCGASDRRPPARWQGAARACGALRVAVRANDNGKAPLALAGGCLAAGEHTRRHDGLVSHELPGARLLPSGLAMMPGSWLIDLARSSRSALRWWGICAMMLVMSPLISTRPRPGHRC